jgi:hypothetical protein
MQDLQPNRFHRDPTASRAAQGRQEMSKGQERKKETKKKPQKSLAEKRAAKEAKRKSRG